MLCQCSAEALLVANVDRNGFRLGRCYKRVLQERQQFVRIEHTGEHSARIEDGPLVRGAMPVDIVIEEFRRTAMSDWYEKGYNDDPDEDAE